MATLRSPTPHFGGPHFGGPRYGGPPHGFMPRGPPGGGYGERLGFNFRPSMPGQGGLSSYDGKKLRTKPLVRKTVDYSSSVTNFIKNRIYERDHRDRASLQPDVLYATHVTPPNAQPDHPMNCVCTKYVRNASNKIKCPIFCVCWTPEGRRLITGASSGEFTLWNGLTFSFETILQAHDTSVRAMVWNHSGQWMVTGDHGGYVKYWQINMNNVKMYQAHKDAVRGISFCPTDTKFATCSDDGTVRVWDFLHCSEERILRGHGADVKCVDWHPQKGLIASGSRDSQQPIILWDPRMGTKLSTVHAHKSTVMEVSWNRNGNWLLTASRDHLIKLFDIRNMKEEAQSFKGHKKEATTIAWHPIHESLFASGGSDGQILYWLVGQDREVGCINEAHETMVWSLAWHPMGHILVSGSNDHSSKFWTRNRPGDGMRDKYNLNLLPQGVTEDMLEYDDLYQGASIPGMGLEYMPQSESGREKEKQTPGGGTTAIPGLDFSVGSVRDESRREEEKRKTPYAKPVPRDFQLAWSEGKQPESLKTQHDNEEDTEEKAPPDPSKPPSLLDMPPISRPTAKKPARGGFRAPARGMRAPSSDGRRPPPRTEAYEEETREEEFTLPGMGGPLPGPEHEPTLPPSRDRRFQDGPITTANPADPAMAAPSGGLLGDRPGDQSRPRLPFQQQPPANPPHQRNRSGDRSQNWSASSGDRWQSGGNRNNGGDFSSTPQQASYKRRSYDDPMNSSQEDVFYDSSRSMHSSDANSDSGSGQVNDEDPFGAYTHAQRGANNSGSFSQTSGYNSTSGDPNTDEKHQAFGKNPRKNMHNQSYQDNNDSFTRNSAGNWRGNTDRGRGRGLLSRPDEARGRGMRGRGGRGRGGEDSWGERGRGRGGSDRGGRGGGRGGDRGGRGGYHGSTSSHATPLLDRPMSQKRSFDEGPGTEGAQGHFLESQGNRNNRFGNGENRRDDSSRGRGGPRGGGRGQFGRGGRGARGRGRGMART